MEQLKKLISSLSVRQRITIAVTAALVATGLYYLALWNGERSFKPLYTGLSAEDAGEVVQKLRESGIEYRIDQTGGIVRIPEDRVPEVRLQMATAGLPKTGRIGFELFDKTNFGQTDFAEQVNYRRAIEGELERSIMSLGEVEQARIHVSLPKDSVFLESRQDAKASVLLRLRPGARLAPQSVLGICHLVASAVDRLAPEAVTVLDMRGNLLMRPRKPLDEENGVAPEAGLEYKEKIERALVAKMREALEPLVGSGRFQTAASVDVDFSVSEQSDEIVDPAQSAILTSQKTEEVAGLGGPGSSGGVPGTASNLPRPASRVSTSVSGNTRTTENITYQSSKTIRRVRVPQGLVKRISLSVLLDHDVRWEGAGASARRVLEPPAPEKLETIRKLVASATGFNTERGDQLTVESLPFEITLNSEPPGAGGAPAPAPPIADWQRNFPPAIQKLLIQMNLWIWAGVGLLLLALLLAPIVWFLTRRRKRARVTGQGALDGSEAGQITGPDGQLVDVSKQFQDQFASATAVRERREAAVLNSLKLPGETKKSEILAKHLRQQSKDDPQAVAQLLRTWIHDTES
ncbi:MAG: flagellar basal-body MS-ring/collar protein FliF [Bryobacteraceae bacterium]